MVLSVLQVCAMLGCKERQVFYLLSRGLLERAPRYGKEIRIYTDSVEALLARPEALTTRKPRAPRKVKAPPLWSRDDAAI